MSEVKTTTFEDLLRERMSELGIDVEESIRRLGDEAPKTVRDIDLPGFAIPDPRRPLAVMKPEWFEVFGLQPGESPGVRVTGTLERWVRDRRPQREARRVRMARKKRRGW